MNEKFLHGNRRLKKNIEQVEIQRSKKEAQLKQVIREQRKSKTDKKAIVFKDRNGKVISVGDWVKTTTPGKFKLNEGRDIGFNLWVTFEDVTGIKQTRVSKNLVVCSHARKCHAKVRGSSLSTGSE